MSAEREEKGLPALCKQIRVSQGDLRMCKWVSPGQETMQKALAMEELGWLQWLGVGEIKTQMENWNFRTIGLK